MMMNITWEELKTHKTDSDAWIVVHGNVYNVSKFLEDHPGGQDIILEVAGQDATDVFEEAAHSSEARDMLPLLEIGRLEGYHNEPRSKDSISPTVVPAAKTKGTLAKVILLTVTVPVVVFAFLPCSRVTLTGMRSFSAQDYIVLNPVWASILAIQALLLLALGRFATSFLYVDFGRLEKYPSLL
ncbi:cytochrome b5-like heme/steroid binding domain-containing protein [Xylaria scruposa]|nr:cytochrome b5-like heme/steroid binding domain-containing protein [Xylaria scruposa]